MTKEPEEKDKQETEVSFGPTSSQAVASEELIHYDGNSNNSETNHENYEATSSEGEQSGNTINIDCVANQTSGNRFPEEHPDAFFGRGLHHPHSSCQGTNHPPQTCTKALIFPTPSPNTIFALKGDSGDHRDFKDGNTQDFFVLENPVKNLFPKRKISSMGELMDEAHPLIFALCYLLACLANVTGVDFVTVLGILLTLISMISMIFI